MIRRPLAVLALCAAPLPALAASPDACEIAAGVGGWAMELRLEGLSQQRAADRLAAGISEAINGASAPTADKRAAAAALGQRATELLRVAYSVPASDANPDAMAEATYEWCRSEW